MSPSSRIPAMSALVVTLLPACTSAPPTGGASAARYQDEVTAGLEEIYVTRTVRTQYIAGATPGCAAAAPTSVSEQHYQAWSLGLSAQDARIVDSHEKPVGEFVACFSAPTPAGTFAMYTRGTVAAITYAGTGECRFMKAKPPAAKLLVLACYGDLTDLPAGYVGGYLTTSSLAPSGGKDAADIRGYLLTSVITMRLWKSAH